MFFNISNNTNNSHNISKLSCSINSLKENLFEQSDRPSYLSLVKNLHESDKVVCKIFKNQSIDIEESNYRRPLTYSLTHIKFNYLDDDDDSDIVESKVSDKVIEIKPITDNNNSSPSNSYNFNDKNNKDFLDKASDTYQNSIISKAVDYKFTDNSPSKAVSHSPSKFSNMASQSSPKHKSRSSNRISVLSFKDKSGSRRTSCLRSSMFYLSDKNSNINELALVHEMSAIYHFKTREDLIRNKTDIETINKKPTKKVNKVKIESIKGNLITKPIIMRPIGIENSLRHCSDCISFVGYNENDNVNDYVLNNENYIFNYKIFTKTLFAFTYDFQCNKYFLQPIIDKDKQSRFIIQKIVTPYVFISQKIIFINRTIIQVTQEKK